MKKLFFYAFVGSLATLTGCHDSLDLVGAFKPQLVVYCVLSTETDTQYVRILPTYNPQSGANSQSSKLQEITNALVTVTNGSNTITFHDTVATPSTESDGDSVNFYVAYGFVPQGGMSYTLTVSSPGYETATATTTVPTHTILDIDYRDNVLIKSPWYNPDLQPTVSFQASAGASAFLPRLVLEYEDHLPTGVILKHVLIPQWIELISCYIPLYDFHYPEITKIDVSPGAVITHRYTNWAWRRNVDLIIEQYGYDPYFKHGRFSIIQFSGNWYKYYRAARSFQDRFSVRLDEPDFSNVTAGHGVFGAFVVDTVSLPMPDHLTQPKNYNECQ